jgi:hypothetical protein
MQLSAMQARARINDTLCIYTSCPLIHPSSFNLAIFPHALYVIKLKLYGRLHYVAQYECKACGT